MVEDTYCKLCFFPLLSGRPAIFQLLLGVETSIPHLAHFTISFSSTAGHHFVRMMDKKLSSISEPQLNQLQRKEVRRNVFTSCLMFGFETMLVASPVVLQGKMSCVHLSIVCGEDFYQSLIHAGILNGKGARAIRTTIL